MASKLAIITGISGQDGRTLSHYLVSRDYRVVGVSRRTSTQEMHERVRVVSGDINDAQFIDDLIAAEKPDEFYNLAAQSFVERSWSQPTVTAESTGLAVIQCLEAIRKHSPSTRFFQASSSEIFGNVLECPQTELTPLSPRSPYATSKLFAYWSVRNYRDRYGIFACNGIMYNHESTFRGLEFVTRKITYTAAQIKLGLASQLKLGSLNALRDWGWAPDYVEGMVDMLKQSTPDDFILATGKLHTVKDWVEIAFQYLGLDWQKYVEIDPQFSRKSETVQLCGDATKAWTHLGWKPKMDFKTMVETMVDHDFKMLSRPAVE